MCDASHIKSLCVKQGYTWPQWLVVYVLHPLVWIASNVSVVTGLTLLSLSNCVMAVWLQVR